MADYSKLLQQNPFDDDNFGPPLSGMHSPSSQNPNKMQIVTHLYKTIFGREVDATALRYYIQQSNVDEHELRKKMIESKEHENILAEYKNIETLKKEIEELKRKINSNEKIVKDKESEIEELNKILFHKSKEIAKARDEVENIKKTHETQRVKISTESIAKIDIGLKKVVKEFFKKIINVDRSDK